MVTPTCIWNKAEHSAFTDLVRYRDKWLCCFRESDTHALGRDGILRVLESNDGDEWETAAEIALDGFDLRDPHFCVTSDGRLMLSCAGRVQADGKYIQLQSFTAFSTNGREWTPLVPSGPGENWIWQVSWIDGFAYSWVRELNPPGVLRERPLRLMRSQNGIVWETIAEETSGNEACILTTDNGRMYACLRGYNSVIGESEAPYTHWKWTRAGYFIGGPQLTMLSNGQMIAGGRMYRQPSSESHKKNYDPVMMLHDFDLESNSLRPILELPSGGDCSYPGFVEHEGDLWVSYYSAHEGHCAIYLARVPLAELSGDLSGLYPPLFETGPVNDLSGINDFGQKLHARHLAPVEGAEKVETL